MDHLTFHHRRYDHSQILSFVCTHYCVVVVIGIIIALAYPRCKRRIKERKAKASSSPQKYQKLDETESITPGTQTTVTEVPRPLLIHSRHTLTLAT